MTIEYSDRYTALGITPSGCEGPCEGTGFVPVYMGSGDSRPDSARPGDESDPALIARWEAMEQDVPSTDGWHFVRCPTCSP